MRLRHFEELSPICPRCYGATGDPFPLKLSQIAEGSEAEVVEGLLTCSRAACQLEFPIIDGIPILVVDVRNYVARSLPAILRRHDLSSLAESVLGDCMDAGSDYDVERQHLSMYVWDHYGSHDPEETSQEPKPGGAERCLAAGLSIDQRTLSGPAIDLGTAVGGTAIRLAESTDSIVLGTDLSFPMIRTARQVSASGEVDYLRRRIGVVYDRRRFEVPRVNLERVDFWVADALLPPFPPGRFGFVSAINLIDCVSVPSALVGVVARLLRPGGSAVLTTPFDWSASATPIENWIGGHSQRQESLGASEPLLETLLASGGGSADSPSLSLAGVRDDIDWAVRMHDRASMSYKVRALALHRD